MDASGAQSQPPPRLNENNLILMTDSYKLSHYKQYPPDTTGVYSYFESRTGAAFTETVFFGLQSIIKRYLIKGVTRDNLDEAVEFVKAHMPQCALNVEGWEHILTAHDGRLPVRIRAVPEGMSVPTGNVIVTVENTDPKCFWLTNYLETILTSLWYPSTVATQSRIMKDIIGRYLRQTTGHTEGLSLKLHDFGFRGTSSPGAAALGCAAHLTSFEGTDTLVGLTLLRNDYSATMAGFSIPAAEHSTMTSWGREHEVDAYRNMLRQYPTGPVSVVSDSYDIENACEHIWGGVLRDEVLARDGVLVIRPDSGVPKDVVLRVHDILGRKFGYTMIRVGGKEYKKLHGKVAVMQGDGIDLHSIAPILKHLKQHGWSTGGLTLGSGGGLLQKINRDTQRFAFKCSAVERGGVWHDVFKAPATDPTKASKRGRLKLVGEAGNYRTVREHDRGDDQLIEVFRDGQLLVDHTFEEIRARTAHATPKLAKSRP